MPTNAMADMTVTTMCNCFCVSDKFLPATKYPISILGNQNTGKNIINAPTTVKMNAPPSEMNPFLSGGLIMSMTIAAKTVAAPAINVQRILRMMRNGS
jgi:hypothetical protein